MNDLFAAFYRTSRHWRLVLLTLAVSIVWIAAFFLWLGIPVATSFQLVAQSVGALVLLLVPCLLVRFIFRRAGGTRIQLTPTLFIAAFFASIFGGLIPYRLIWWIPQLKSLGTQAVSMAARFSLAAVLFSFCLVCIVVVAANPNGKDLPASEQ